LPLHALPWLPRPQSKLRDALAALPADPLAALAFLQSLSLVAWGEAELRQIGRKITAILKSAPSGFDTEARTSGLPKIRLLILSASTASHLADALIGTALRFRFLLDVTLAEYEEPEPWLLRNSAALKAEPPDFVLVASDSRMLRLSSPLGDAKTATQVID